MWSKTKLVTASAVQRGATWGLDRTDQRSLPLNGAYRYGTTAPRVTAYIIDTGIRSEPRRVRRTRRRGRYGS